MSLVALAQGVIPPTLNYNVPDPDCPVSVATEPRTVESRTFVKLNHNTMGQATAVVVTALYLKNSYRFRMARSISRLASRLLSDSRLSCFCLPLQMPSRTLARPALKYILSGTSVRPFS